MELPIFQGFLGTLGVNLIPPSKFYAGQRAILPKQVDLCLVDLCAATPPEPKKRKEAPITRWLKPANS